MLYNATPMARVKDRVSAALLGAGAPDAPAVIDGSLVITYSQLRDRVSARRDELALAPRSLVVLEGASTAEFVTTYLALLADDHVPLVAGDHADRLAATWAADALVDVGGDGLRIERSTAPAERLLHPDLALLLSTSGSTGSPKLVRLSHDNLVSNADAIASYLRLDATDRGITTLPFHYCYGLSVLHSHLVTGGSVVTTTASVVDRCFASAMWDHGVTNVAGVPHTFELLERVGPEVVHVPTLRFLTQAGGRMAPARIAEWLDRGRRWGTDFYVMYGQTEATARMAYLPTDVAVRHPESIGRAIPGGRLELRPVDGVPEGVGELVYRGPNVMLGYATAPADLAAGAVLEELATGDLARFHPDDEVFEIVGRRSRFVKPFGLRVDLDAVEADLRTAGIEAAVAGDDTRLVVCAPDSPRQVVRHRIVELTGLPTNAVDVATSAIPRTASGKVDYEAVPRLEPVRPKQRPPRRQTSVTGIFATVLGRDDITPGSTFVSLGGDSLNYVECSVRLEQLLGPLPRDWQLETVAELESREPRRGWPRLDTSAVMRAAGILAVLATHMSLWYFPGGSHLMLAVVGYNMSRFLLAIDDTRQRVVAGLRTVGRVAGPVIGWVGICMLLVGSYGIPTLTLVNNYLGPAKHLDGRWHYWFIEALIQLVLLTTALLAIGPVRRFERRFDYLFPLLLLAGALTFRYHWLLIDGLGNLRFRTHGVAWFFVLGWLADRSTTFRRQVLTTVICLTTLPGFFGRPEREWFIAGGIVLLIWRRDLPLPRAAIHPIAVVAAASMWIYVSHFRIWPPLARNLPDAAAYVLTILAGIAIWRASTALGSLVSLRGRRQPELELDVVGVPEDDDGGHRRRRGGREADGASVHLALPAGELVTPAVTERGVVLT
jgi:non-ribosomal peptide synthetase component E (peptide arylation enzyme)/acyl carrier protein